MGERERVTTAAWPDDGVLTVEKLLSVMAPIMEEKRLREFARTVREADEVEVRVSPFAERGTIYALDPSSTVHFGPPGPVMVICHADQEAMARDIVDRVRATGQEEGA